MAQHARSVMRHDFFADQAAAAAYAALMDAVFSIDVVARDAKAGTDPAWIAFAAFADDGACVASVETAVLRLLCDGESVMATGLRSVAVHPDWRGRGLFRDLTLQALDWCGHCAGPVLLYTGEPALYTRFGFAPVAQHAFVGTPPTLGGGEPARALDLAKSSDLDLMKRLLAIRAPVSTRCALTGAPSLLLTALDGSDDLVAMHSPTLDAVAIIEIDNGTLTLADIVAATIPSIGELLATLPRARRLRTLFPPDRLGWAGAPQPDDTGLMARGDVPAAMRRPFMLPPTTEF